MTHGAHRIPLPHSRSQSRGRAVKRNWSGSSRGAHKVHKVERLLLNLAQRAIESQSRSRTSTTEGHTAADDLHSGKSKNKAVIWLHKKPKGSHPLTMTYVQQNTGYFANPSSQQLIVSICKDFAVEQMYYNTSVTSSTGSTQAHPLYDTYAQDLFWFNPYKRPTNNPLTGSSTNMIDYNSLMFIKSVTYELQLANHSNYAADVVLLCITPKKNLTTQDGFGTAGYNNASVASQFSGVGSPIVAFFGDQQANTYLVPAVQATDASGVYTNATVGFPSATTHGVSPFQFHAFRNLYKGLYKKEFNLAGGAIHKCEIRVHVNKWVKESALSSLSYGGAGGVASLVIPGLTLDWEMIIRGSPVVLDNNGALNSTQQDGAATMGQVGIAFTLVRKIEFGFKQVESMDMHAVAPNFYVPSGTSGGKIMNIVDTAVSQAFVS